MAKVNGVHYPQGGDKYDLPGDWRRHARTDAQQALDAAHAARLDALDYTDVRVDQLAGVIDPVVVQEFVNNWPAVASEDAAVAALIASGATATRGQLNRLRTAVSATDHGAIGDGIADDTMALQAAVDEATLTGLPLHLSGVNYRVTQEITATGAAVSITGAGPGSTVITWDAASTSVGLRINVTEWAHRVNITGLTLSTKKASVDTALTIDNSSQEDGTGRLPERLSVRHILRDIEIAGDIDGPDDTSGFLVGLHIINPLHTIIESFHFRGQRNAPDPSNPTSDKAIYLEGTGTSAAVMIRDMWAYHTKIGVDAYGTEGVVLQGFNLVTVGTGFRYDTPDDVDPQYVIADGHMNVFNAAVDINKGNIATIRNVVVFQRGGSTAPGVAFTLNDVHSANIDGCYVGKVDLSKTFDGIRLTGNSRRNRIDNNVFTATDTAIHLGPGTTENVIGRQIYQAVGANFVDEGTGNIRESSSAIVTLASNQSIPTGTGEIVNWTSESRDDSAWFNPAQDNRLTVPVGVSRVRVTANLSWAGSAGGGRRIARALKNGVSLAAGLPWVRDDVGSTGCVQNLTSPVLDVVAGDYFEVSVEQDSGGPLNLTTTASWFAIEAVE